jgi:pentalenolactone synthase
MSTAELPRLPFPRPDVLDVAPLYRALQDEAPVVPVRTPAGDPAWLVTRHAEARALFADPRLGRSHPDPARAARISGSALLGGPMGDPATEAAGHARMRRLLVPAFSARRMAGLRAHVAELAGGLLDDLLRQGPPADLHEGLSFPLPVLVICELLGVPFADRDRFRAWSQGCADLTDRAASAAALGELVGYTRELAARKRREPGDDLISDLIAAEEGLGDDEVAGLSAVLLFAGHETTVVRIDLGALLLMTHPDQAGRLRREPALVPTAVEEILRVAAPSGVGLPRYAHEDVDVAGVRIRAGDAVLLSSTVTNRDPGVFADPGLFDVGRSPNPHLSFGHGPRYCIGAGLARIELQEVFTALPARLPGLRLAVPVAELRLRDDLLTGGLTALPVTW